MGCDVEYRQLPEPARSVSVLKRIQRRRPVHSCRPPGGGRQALRERAGLLLRFARVSAAVGICQQSLRRLINSWTRVGAPGRLPGSSTSWMKKKMMAVDAVRNCVCAVLQTPVGAVVYVHRRGGVHSLRSWRAATPWPGPFGRASPTASWSSRRSAGGATPPSGRRAETWGEGPVWPPDPMVRDRPESSWDRASAVGAFVTGHANGARNPRCPVGDRPVRVSDAVDAPAPPEDLPTLQSPCLPSALGV